MMKKCLFLLSLIALSLISCSDNEGIFDPTYWSEPYSGITFTGNNAEIFKIDPDDWYYPNSQSNVPFSFPPAFPNPVQLNNERITFVIYLPSEKYLKLYIRDRSDKIVVVILKEELAQGLHFIQWDLRDGKGANLYPDIYRSFIEIEGIIKYGDIWIQ